MSLAAIFNASALFLILPIACSSSTSLKILPISGEGCNLNFLMRSSPFIRRGGFFSFNRLKYTLRRPKTIFSWRTRDSLEANGL